LAQPEASEAKATKLTAERIKWAERQNTLKFHRDRIMI